MTVGTRIIDRQRNLPERKKSISKKNKKCCVCSNPTYGKGLSNDLGTCVCLNCARAIRDIMLQQERNAEARDYRQVVLPNNSCYIPPFPVNQNK